MAADGNLADQVALRWILGHFATGVTIVSAGEGALKSGLTANAVASICLQPPLVLAAVEHASDTHRIIERTGRFAINILSEEQEALSRRFASDLDNKFEGVPHRIGVTGCPIVEEALAHIECRLVEVLTKGDHSIFIGEVVEARHAPAGRPLVFFKSGYHRLEDSRPEAEP